MFTKNMYRTLSFIITIIFVFSLSILSFGAPISQQNEASAASNFSVKGPFTTSNMKLANHTLFYPQNLGKDGMKHPIIIWGNGTGASPSSYTGILNHLASYGFVVIAANTRSSGTGTEMIQGIDIMISQNSDQESVFYNKLDTSSIGASGHSQGGIGTVNAVLKDSRIVCALPLMGTTTGISRIKTPVFAVAGSSDYIVSPTMVKRIYTYATGPAVYAELKGASHMAPTGISPSKEILNYSVAWFKLYLMKDTSLSSVFFDSNSGININNAWVVSFKNANVSPTIKPTAFPTAKPTNTSTAKPTVTPTAKPSDIPTSVFTPTPLPTGQNTDFSQKGPFTAANRRLTNHTLFYPQSLGKDGMKHPIIIWGNGTGATPSSYTGILNHLASYGFVVIAANTTSSGTGTEMIQGIDIMISENSNQGSVFYNKLDISSIGASGHSQGGIGTVNAVLKDSRIVSALPLMGTTTGISRINTPIFAVAGSSDYIVSPTMVKRIYTYASGPAIYAELKGASHMAPTGISPSKEILNYAVAWFKLYLMKDQSLNSVFYDSSRGINADSAWDVTFKNAPIY